MHYWQIMSRKCYTVLNFYCRGRTLPYCHMLTTQWQLVCGLRCPPNLMTTQESSVSTVPSGSSQVNRMGISTTNLVARVCARARAKFDKFLPARSHFVSKRPENFVHIATFPSATFGPLFAFHCPLFFTKNNNSECKSSRFATRDAGNDDFGVEAFWAIHCAHWSRGFMVLNSSISRVLGQRYV